MPRKHVKSDPVCERLDLVIRLLQDLLIMEGVKAGINKEELRKILAIDKLRIFRISKQIKGLGDVISK